MKTARCIETKKTDSGKAVWKLYQLNSPLATKETYDRQLRMVSHVVAMEVSSKGAMYTEVRGSNRYGAALTKSLCMIGGGFDPKKALKQLGYEEIDR